MKFVRRSLRAIYLVWHVENRVRDAVTCIAPHTLRHLTPRLVLRGLERAARRPKTAPRLYDEQIAQVQLARAAVDAALLDQRLRSRERACRGEQLDRHVGQPLQLLLPLDDLSAIVPDETLGRRLQVGNVLLEILFVRHQAFVEVGVERGGCAESALEPRRSEAADQSEIPERPPKRGSDFLQLLGGTLNAVERD